MQGEELVRSLVPNVDQLAHDHHTLFAAIGKVEQDQVDQLVQHVMETTSPGTHIQNACSLLRKLLQVIKV